MLVEIITKNSVDFVNTMGWPFTTIYLLIALGLIYYLFFSIPTGIRSKSWPIAEGLVRSSRFHKHRNIAKNRGKVTLFDTDVEFSYTVDGVEYVSNMFRRSSYRNSGENYHQRIIDSHQKNAVVTVFHDPKKPEIAVLEPGLDQADVFIALLFLASIVFMSFVYILK